MQVWNVLHVARWKHRTQKWCKKSPSGHHRTTLSAWIFGTKARINNRKKNLLNSNISSICPHNKQPTSGWDLLASLWQPSKFQREFASWLRYCSDVVHRRPTTPLHDVWLSPGLVHCVYIFGSCCPLIEFRHVQNSFCVQVLRSAILAALLHGTPAMGSAKLCGMVQGMELRNFCRGRHLYSAGRPSRWASAHILAQHAFSMWDFCNLAVFSRAQLILLRTMNKKLSYDRRTVRHC